MVVKNTDFGVRNFVCLFVYIGIKKNPNTIPYGFLRIKWHNTCKELRILFYLHKCLVNTINTIFDVGVSNRGSN